MRPRARRMTEGHLQRDPPFAEVQANGLNHEVVVGHVAMQRVSRTRHRQQRSYGADCAPIRDREGQEIRGRFNKAAGRGG